MGMLKEIYRGLNDINNEILSVHRDLDTLRMEVRDLHKAMIQSFDVVNRRLDRIQYQLDNIQEISRLTLTMNIISVVPL